MAAGGINESAETKKAAISRSLLKDGTSGRTRTGTPAKAGDFESPVSTNFTTLAHEAEHVFNVVKWRESYPLQFSCQ